MGDAILLAWLEEIEGQDAIICTSRGRVLILLPKWLKGTLHGDQLIMDAFARLARPKESAVA